MVYLVECSIDLVKCSIVDGEIAPGLYHILLRLKSLSVRFQITIHQLPETFKEVRHECSMFQIPMLGSIYGPGAKLGGTACLWRATVDCSLFGLCRATAYWASSRSSFTLLEIENSKWI
jgi:hypothetical protein